MADMHFTTLRPLNAAIFTAVVAAVLIGILGVLNAVDEHPMDRIQDLQRLPGTILFALIVGFLLGGLAGLACQLSHRRVSFLWSLCIVGVCIVFARIATDSPHKTDDRTRVYQSYAAIALAAGLGIGIVVVWGRFRASRAAKRTSTPESPLEP